MQQETRNDFGPQTAFSDHLHATKYREKGESFRECAQRVAFGLQDDDEHYRQLRPILLDMRFLPAGRVQAAIGASFQATAYNCFVSGTVADSFVHDRGSIMDRLKETATTMRLGGGIGYDFSTLRPSGDSVVKLGTTACGPVDFMQLFDGVGTVTRAVGHRHGAQMAILRVDHPDIETFIRAKQNEDKLRRFNISVGVTDEFMSCLAEGKPFQLRFNGRVYREIDAAALWEKLMRSTYEWSEPGVFFVDTVNKMNNLYYCETIAATNPCGEQPLPPFGACLLGSFNLVKYLKKQAITTKIGDLYQGVAWEFDFDLLYQDCEPVVRAMDNIIDRTIYPLPEQKAEAMTKRRMGLGVTGLANAAEACGHVYGTPEFITFMEKVLETIKLACYWASVNRARAKGSFPLFDADRFCRGAFIQTLPDDLQHAIKTYGIRNSHLTSIAPTGTISMCADNVSSGLEPVFTYEIDRTVETANGFEQQTLSDYGYRFLGVKGRKADDVTPAEHVAVLTAAQKHVDSAISKTINVGHIEWDAFKDIYWQAYRGGAKGCTTFNNLGRRTALLVDAKKDDDEAPACAIMSDGTKSCE